MTRLNSKRKFYILLYAIYVTFILISTIPYLAEQELSRGNWDDGKYESHLVFTEDGSYGHYTEVVLKDKDSIGKIDLKYNLEEHTLYIQKVENIKELVIDCKLMFQNKADEVLEMDPDKVGSNFYKSFFQETNNGLFTVIINTDTPMDKLQFKDIPMPKSVHVNKKEWWDTNSINYSLDWNDITITHIPEGSTTVEIYFQELTGQNPTAMFTVSKDIELVNKDVYFDGSLSKDEDGDIEHYIWDFGDGIEGSGILIKHSFSKVGNYTVNLKVRDDDYLEDVYFKVIFIVKEGADSDKDGVADELDPHPYSYLDTDGDGLSDDYEDIIKKTNKTNKDSDNDGWDDDVEIEENTDPNDASDYPGKGVTKPTAKSDDYTGVIIGIVIILVILFIVIFFFLKKRKGGKALEDKPTGDTHGPLEKPPATGKDVATSPAVFAPGKEIPTSAHHPPEKTLQVPMKPVASENIPKKQSETKPKLTTDPMLDSLEMEDISKFLSPLDAKSKSSIIIKTPSETKPKPSIKTITKPAAPTTIKVPPEVYAKALIIKQFVNELGIGVVKAMAVYDSGYQSMEELSHATKSDLLNIKGIGPKMAEKILAKVKK